MKPRKKVLKPALSKRTRVPVPAGQTKPSALNPKNKADLKRIGMFTALGATHVEIAAFIGIAPRTLTEWRDRFPELKQATALAKDTADERVIRALYQRACGYEQEVTKLFKIGDGVRDYPLIEKVPADVAAQIWWLKNRRPEEWRDRQLIGIGGDKDAPAVQVEDKRQSPREIARLIAFALAIGKRSLIDVTPGTD